ncbi:MAG: DUF3365 domain-containing protein [Deltaproteobacteria bacterium]|nr:DUF3365 domain-containing protein [Deltaproteobacteria bacterium]
MADKPTYEALEHKSDLNMIKGPPIRLRYIVITFAIFWTAIIVLSTVWDILATKRTTREIATKEARALFNKDQAVRYWATAHGGVYIPIDKRTPPNPYLSHISERDITTPSSKRLTLMNPAYMIRQLNEEFSDLYGVTGHLTSLKPIRPENAPDAWERSALEAFEKDSQEMVEFTKIQNTPYLRLMKPMITKKGCLKCHEIQGYKTGDIRGGISVSLPLSSYLLNERKELIRNTLTHILFWIVGIVGILFSFQGLKRRIIERVQAEEALIIAKQNAEAASKAKSLFINNMSHELRTPLNGIIVSTDLALGQELSPKVEKILRTIHRSGRAILGTVTAILDFSKSESGKLELAAIPFRLDEVLGKLSGSFIQKGTQKQIKISFDIAADKVSNALIGDPDRLVDVFNHLLDNAAKFSTGTPKAVIGVREVNKSVKKTTLDFYVKDNGIGIASENFEKIFDAFTQVDTSSTRQYDGTGIGLAVSKRLVEQMGGTIRAESELGKGSTFYFTASFDRQGQEHPFKAPSLKDREDTTVNRVSSKTGGKMGSPELLLELLSTIDPFIQKRKPKPCKEIMAEISRYAWPDEYAQEILELGRLIGKYKFKDAYTIFESIVKKLKPSIS